MVETSPGQKVMAAGRRAPDGVDAAVAKVRSLEHDLLGGDAAEGVVAEINQLRHALGWLEIDADGQWRWPGAEPTIRRGCFG